VDAASALEDPPVRPVFKTHPTYSDGSGSVRILVNPMSRARPFKKVLVFKCTLRPLRMLHSTLDTCNLRSALSLELPIAKARNLVCEVGNSACGPICTNVDRNPSLEIFPDLSRSFICCDLPVGMSQHNRQFLYDEGGFCLSKLSLQSIITRRIDNLKSVQTLFLNQQELRVSKVVLRWGHSSDHQCCILHRGALHRGGRWPRRSAKVLHMIPRYPLRYTLGCTFRAITRALYHHNPALPFRRSPLHPSILKHDTAITYSGSFATTFFHGWATLRARSRRLLNPCRSTGPWWNCNPRVPCA